MKKITFVVGAGASSEAHLPVGQKLKHEIAKLLNFEHDYHSRRQVNGDPQIYKALQQLSIDGTIADQGLSRHTKASYAIRDAMSLARSIDNYLDAHKGDQATELCGKLAIAQAILSAERVSLLAPSGQLNQAPTLKLNALADTWYVEFFQLVVDQCVFSELKNRLAEISFIFFNYDRCLEHFLYHALQTYYRVDGSRAADALSALHIFHPYGTVGALPWREDETSVGFGATVVGNELVNAARNIKTFTEGTSPDSRGLSASRVALSESDLVVFLGFAFHPINISLLWPRGSRKTTKQHTCLASGFGLSVRDALMIEEKLSHLGAFETVEVRQGVPCAEFFRENSQSLSFDY